jgi:excisionase family DNA binding protein
MPDKLLNAAEVAELLGVTRRYVNRLASEHENFPEPAAVFPGARRVWRRSAIERWAKKHGRELSRADSSLERHAYRPDDHRAR